MTNAANMPSWDEFRAHYGAHIDSMIETEVRSQLADLEAPCPISSYSESQLRRFIVSMKPPHEVKAGKELLLKILDTEGVPGLDLFMQRVSWYIREKGGVERETFRPHERELLKECRPNLSRRKVLFGVAGLSGMVLIGDDVCEIGKQLTGDEEEVSHSPKRDQSGWRHLVSQGTEAMTSAKPVVEAATGGVLIYGAKQLYNDTQFEQVRKAISKLNSMTRIGAAPGR
jgi:hypothetical protein